MSGDMLAALLLFASTVKQTRAGVRPPRSVVLLFFSYVGLFLMLADEQRFAVAVTGQVFLGTTYVFIAQALQEMLVFYTGGDASTYQQLLVCSNISMSAGIAVGGLVAIWAYETLGRTVPFVAAAALSLGYAVGCALFFHRSLRSGLSK